MTTLGFPYSISPEFLRRNQHQTLEQALDALQAIYSLAGDEGRMLPLMSRWRLEIPMAMRGASTR